MCSWYCKFFLKLYDTRQKCSVQVQPSASFQVQGSLITPAAHPGRPSPSRELQDPLYSSTGRVITWTPCLFCSCASTAKQTTGAPASVSCLCWPRVTHHPSEVTLAPFHKVNLPLKTWYLLTRLIEIDGSMTFIEFFYELVLVLTPFIQASVCLGCYSSWTPALAAIVCLIHTSRCAHTHTERGRHRWLKLWTTLSYSNFCTGSGFIFLFTDENCMGKLGQYYLLSLHSLSHQYFNEMKPNHVQGDSYIT